MSSLIISFFVVHLIYSSDDRKLINLFFIWFLVFCAINGITAVIDGLILKKRAFGIAGIMFVDYLSIGIIISFIWMILSRKIFFFLLLLTFFFLGTILHQTRGVWIALSITLILGLLYFMVMSHKYSLNRTRIWTVLVVISSIGIGSFFLIKGINPHIEQRATSLQKNEISIDQEGYIDNSLITRALIWHTAYNAFNSHPIVGIGSHSFAFQSRTYSTLNPFLYAKYVKGLTPHGTFFAILAEVGIIGFLGFVTLLFLSLKHSFNNILLSVTSDDKRKSATLFFILVYITLSMVITDAWLFGSGAILWGIVLGMTTLENKQLLSNEK